MRKTIERKVGDVLRWPSGHSDNDVQRYLVTDGPDGDDQYGLVLIAPAGHPFYGHRFRDRCKYARLIEPTEQETIAAALVLMGIDL